jgi:mannosyltransferase
MRSTRSGQAAPGGPAGPGSPEGRARVRRGNGRPDGPRSRWRLEWLVVVMPAVAELLVGGYRLAGPSLWRDEAATISGSQRPYGAILAMMANEDAVHGPYYLLMHPVITAGGISAAALRLPSLIAMCLAAGLTAALARRLAAFSGLPGASAVGLTAGLMLVAVPLTTRYAQEARPYALATLFAVLATYLLVRAVADPRPRPWALYAAALLLTGLFNLFALLLAVAHGASLAWGGRAARLAPPGPPGPPGGPGPPGPHGLANSAAQPDRADRGERREGQVTGPAVRGWLAACAAAAVALAPLAYLSAGQSSQLKWVARPNASTIASLLRDFAGATALIPVLAVLVLLGCVAGQGLRRGAGLTPAAVTVPWLALPPVLLIIASLIHPVYVERYVVFCLPALAILSSAGLAWLAVVTRRALAGRGLGTRLSDSLAFAPSVALAAVIVIAVISPQREIRQVGARVDDLRAVASVIAARERPDDAVLYLPRDTALVGVAYPAPFRRLRDVGLGETPIASATLRGTAASPAVIAARLRGVRRLWTVQWAKPLSRSTAAPANLARLLAPLRPAGRWRIRSVLLRLYVRKR